MLCLVSTCSWLTTHTHRQNEKCVWITKLAFFMCFLPYVINGWLDKFETDKSVISLPGLGDGGPLWGRLELNSNLCAKPELLSVSMPSTNLKANNGHRQKKNAQINELTTVLLAQKESKGLLHANTYVKCSNGLQILKQHLRTNCLQSHWAKPALS